jgi:hypothetical protein
MEQDMEKAALNHRPPINWRELNSIAQELRWNEDVDELTHAATVPELNNAGNLRE